ncbi:MAG: cytochrome c3 family protein, partial [Candidatus Eiseniibacteriota bacterium]
MERTRKFADALSGFGRAIKRFLLGRQDEDVRPTTGWQKFLHWFGIHLPRDKKDRIHIRPRLFRLLGLGLLVILILFVGLFEYSTSPRFCNSCHIMRPYYDAWKTSRHNFVRCVECHYPPGKRDELRVKFQAISQVAKFVTRTYGSKPYAEVEDESCLRGGCHEARLLEGITTFKRGIIFDHGPHLTEPRRGRRLRCTSCHSQIVVGTHMVVTETTCFLCHFKGEVQGRETLPLAGCSSCHEPPAGAVEVGGISFSHEEFVGKRHVPCQSCHLDAIQGDGRAPMERCLACHNEPRKLEDIEDMPGLHDNHVTLHNVECSRCHEEIKHAVRTTLTPLDYGCTICHEYKHSAQKEMFMGTGGRDFHGIPSHMFIAQVDCIACHTEPMGDREQVELTGSTYRASQKACVQCHGEEYDGLLRLWQETFDVMLGELKPKLSRVSSAVESAKKAGKSPRAADSLLANARHNARFVEIGRGVHNVFYAAGLLHVANTNLDRAMDILGEQPVSLGKHSYLGGDYCARLCHSRVGVEMPSVVQVFGSSLSHRRHFIEHDVSCTECHSSESHKEVSVTPEGCNSCHHEQTSSKCANCHDVQSALYEGSFMSQDSAEEQPGLMFGAVDCRGCHTKISHMTAHEIVSRACESCHEEGYAEMLN